LTDPPSDSCDHAKICILAPVPLLTVTIEPGSEDAAEVHIHAGGQGIWVGRMAALLGEVILCAALGGETGRVLRGLIAEEEVIVRGIEMQDANPVYVHDRREGQREELARSEAPRLSRHETDDLYGAALAAAMTSDLVVLTGPQPESVIDSDVYARLASDLAKNKIAAVADLAGEHLREAPPAGIRLMKISSDRLVEDGYAEGDSEAQLVAGLERLADVGAQNVVVSREEQPALALVEGQVVEVSGPRFNALDPHGAGDSQTAAIQRARDRGDETAAPPRRSGSGSPSPTSRCHDVPSARSHTFDEASAKAPVPSAPTSAREAGDNPRGLVCPNRPGEEPKVVAQRSTDAIRRWTRGPHPSASRAHVGGSPPERCRRRWQPQPGRAAPRRSRLRARGRRRGQRSARDSPGR
jgi:1-phosphofructokinase